MKPMLPIIRDVYVTTINSLNNSISFSPCHPAGFICECRSHVLQFAVFMIFLSLGWTANATTIVAVVNGDTVVLAADGKRTLRAEEGSVQFLKVCKLHLLGGVAVAFGGITNGWNPEEIAREAGRGALNVHYIADAFASMGYKAFSHFVEEQKISAPRTYRKYISDSNSGATFIGVDEFGDAAAYQIRFHVDPAGGRIEVFRKQIPPTNHRRGVGYLLDGESKHAEAFAKTLPYGTMDPAQLARELVSREIADSPESVGPPISIVRIVLGKLEWVDRPAVCQERRAAKQNN